MSRWLRIFTLIGLMLLGGALGVSAPSWIQAAETQANDQDTEYEEYYEDEYVDEYVDEDAAEEPAAGEETEASPEAAPAEEPAPVEPLPPESEDEEGLFTEEAPAEENAAPTETGQPPEAAEPEAAPAAGETAPGEEPEEYFFEEETAPAESPFGEEAGGAAATEEPPSEEAAPEAATTPPFAGEEEWMPGEETPEAPEEGFESQPPEAAGGAEAPSATPEGELSEEEQFLEEEAGAGEEGAAPQEEELAPEEEYEIFAPEEGEEAFTEPVPGEEEWEGWAEEAPEGEMAEIEKALEQAERIPSILTTLEECKRVALLNDRRVQVALKQVQYERFKVQEAEREFLPLVKGTWEREEGTAEEQTTPSATEDMGFKSLKYGLEGEQIFFQGGKLVYTLRQAKNNLAMAKKKYQQARQEAVFKVEKAYYSLIAAQMTFDIQADLSKAAESALAFSREAYRQGLNSFHEFLNVQSQTDQTYYQLLTYQQEITLAELELRQACNIDPSIGIQIDAVLTFTDFNFNYSLDECLELAFKNRPDLAVNELTTLSDLYGIKIAMADAYPLVKFIGYVGKTGQNKANEKFVLDDEYNLKLDLSWMIGANTAKYLLEKKKTIPQTIGTQNNVKDSLTHKAEVDFFDKMENFSKVSKAQVQQATSEADLIELRGKVANEVEENYFKYQRAMTQVTATLSKIKFREKDLEVNRAKQMMDEIPLSQVLTSEISLAEQRVEYVKALSDYYVAISGLFKAMGLIK